MADKEKAKEKLIEFLRNSDLETMANPNPDRGCVLSLIRRMAAKLPDSVWDSIPADGSEKIDDIYRQ